MRASANAGFGYEIRCRALKRKNCQSGLDYTMLVEEPEHVAQKYISRADDCNLINDLPEHIPRCNSIDGYVSS